MQLSKIHLFYHKATTAELTELQEYANSLPTPPEDCKILLGIMPRITTISAAIQRFENYSKIVHADHNGLVPENKSTAYYRHEVFHEAQATCRQLPYNSFDFAKRMDDMVM